MPRFLIVDNDPWTVRAMTQLLQGDGHEVAAFTKGADAVDAMCRDSFDVVMTDLNMPRVGGRAVVSAAREVQPNACIVVVTPKAREKLEDLVAAGACIVADKPVQYDEVTKLICDCRARGGPNGLRCHMRQQEPQQQLMSVRRA